MPPKLHLERVGLRYERHFVFRDVTFSARGGESWAITGPNGIGKSSLLSIIAKYRIPSEGKLTYEPASVAFAWQSPHVHPPADLHVRDIVRDWQRYKPSEINSDFYDRWKLPAHKPLHMLSSGMRQRLLVGLTLSLTTGIILLDEPTAHLDEDYRKQIQSEIVSRMTNPELLVVCATNDPNEAALFPRILNLKEYAA